MPRRLHGWLHYRGSRVQCPCCRSEYREFAPFNGRDRVCWHCGSLERDRLVWLFLDRNPHLVGEEQRILHIAPEPILRTRLEPTASEYVSGDLTATFGDRVLDVTRLDLPSAWFDVVICNHVLEHVPNDRAAMRELRRVLRPGGWALVLVPDVSAERTIEGPSVVDPAERRLLYGQCDHVRRYGLDYVHRLVSAGFIPEVVDMSRVLSPNLISRHRVQKFGELEPIFICR
jgi:SAM-dependent methyltransferase